MWIYYYKSYNELMLILTNNVNSFYIIILNLIINISFIKILYIYKLYDIILSLINKLTKYVIIIKDNLFLYLIKYILK